MVCRQASTVPGDSLCNESPFFLVIKEGSKKLQCLVRNNKIISVGLHKV